MRNWVSPRQMHALLGVSVAIIHNRIRNGQIDAVLVGGRWRIPMTEYERLRDEGIPKPKSRSTLIPIGDEDDSD